MEKPLNDILVEMKSSFDSFIGAAEQLISEQKTKPEFKKGDFIISKKTGNLAIFSHFTSKKTFDAIWRNNTDEKHSNLDFIIELFRLCTDSEKQLILDSIHAEGKDWDAEKCEVVDYIWQPKRGEKFWYVYGKMAYPSSRECINVQETLIELGNYYKTRELAEDAAQAEIEFRKNLKHY